MIKKCRKKANDDFWCVKYAGDNLEEIEDLLRDEPCYISVLNKETKEIVIVEDFDETFVKPGDYILLNEEHGNVFAMPESIFRMFYEEITE